MINTLEINVFDEINDLGIIVNFVIFKNIQNRKTDQLFNDFQENVFSEIIQDLSREMLKQDPVLEGYRMLRTELGLSGSKTICSSEALLKLLLGKGSLPQINLLVDICNLLSVKTHISIGAHALDKIVQHLDFRITSGDEIFIPMGTDEPVKVQKGEYAYIDGSNEVLCRLDHRQCNKTRILESTKSCLLVIQGNPDTTINQIDRTTKELLELISQYCGGDAEIIRQ